MYNILPKAHSKAIVMGGDIFPKKGGLEFPVFGI
jgi:hypothetical protein